MARFRFEDLTYAIGEDNSKYPSDPEPVIRRKSARWDWIENPMDIYDESGFVVAGTGIKKVKSSQTDLKIRPHHGTHVDAPAHKIPHGKTIDLYPPEKFIVDACLVDLEGFCNTGYVQTVTSEMLKEYFAKNDIKGNPKALLFRTGYEKYIVDRTNPKGFSYFDAQAARYIRSQFNLELVGIDSFSFDPSGSNSESHLEFLEADILLVETLVNLYKLRDFPEHFTFRCTPIIIKRADAAPTRAYAEVEV